MMDIRLRIEGGRGVYFLMDVLDGEITKAGYGFRPGRKVTRAPMAGPIGTYRILGAADIRMFIQEDTGDPAAGDHR